LGFVDLEAKSSSPTQTSGNFEAKKARTLSGTIFGQLVFNLG